MRDQKGFTLIEMLIVLTIIATLLILLIPNIAKKNSEIQTKGCDALKQMIENQMQTYVVDTGRYPDTVNTLVQESYIKSDQCSNQTKRIVFSDTSTHELEIVAKRNE
ncbi:comG operon protein 3 [Paraliobacillus ryukyuensis]|uniref:ComG operon protein 3 n=1 Tax=Paraliobacillus ryukyuensis TaxID=200904 RepID=A0A366EIV7_9BACI|nr:competence type IV pilus major pilin ComGC [Paraliobacillus ryukyuensis]RBP01409.1 competence protein ComGC [Paraliobacillus ryukyuensis]